MTNKERIDYEEWRNQAMKKERVKPRLAEILGVEVGEPFRVVREDLEVKTMALKVTWDGALAQYDTDATYTSIIQALYLAIENPNSIVKLGPSLTTAERKKLKAIGADWVSEDPDGSAWVKVWKGKPRLNDKFYTSKETSDVHFIGQLDAQMFPSVKPSDCVAVEVDKL